MVRVAGAAANAEFVYGGWLASIRLLPSRCGDESVSISQWNHVVMPEIMPGAAEPQAPTKAPPEQPPQPVVDPDLSGEAPEEHDHEMPRGDPESAPWIDEPNQSPAEGPDDLLSIIERTL